MQDSAKLPNPMQKKTTCVGVRRKPVNMIWWQHVVCAAELRKEYPGLQGPVHPAIAGQRDA
eukprot:1251960-Pyramimonas_sp.AAC.1